MTPALTSSRRRSHTTNDHAHHAEHALAIEADDGAQASSPPSTNAASFASASLYPSSLSATATPGGNPSCTATTSVPSLTSRSVHVTVISPFNAGSFVSNSDTSTTVSSTTSRAKCP